MEEISLDELKLIIDLSIKKLFEKDTALFDSSVHERSVTHKLANYMQELLPNYDVDCEYNKLDYAVKKLADRNTGHERSIIPDIIVHGRNNSLKNLLFIETKLNYKQKDVEFDISKIKDSMHDERYQYRYGLLIVFNRNHSLHTEWFDV